MKHETIELDAASPAENRRGEHHRKSFLRPFLLGFGPVVVLASAAVAYLHGGRFISTDNAYVHASIVPVTAQVSGPITSVSVHDNERVEAGQVLFTIDRSAFEIAAREADGALDKARSDTAALKASYRQKAREIVQAETDRAYAAREWGRQRRLAAANVVSKRTLDQARHNYDLAAQTVGILHEELSQIAASLDGGPDLPTDRNPAVRQALARRDAARLDLDRTIVHAPIRGRVSEAPSPGQYVASGAPVFSLVADRGLWIEANFKETELTHLRPGQLVRIDVDTYPGRHWAGSVESVAQATGAVFSVLPAQNASGNWVKVVQRIPVRIAIQAEPGAPVLRAGMSVELSVDTGHRRTLSGLLRSVRRLFGL
jgi:membrane fusion protein, multidrug efflux system